MEQITFHEDWEREGALIVDNPQTIDRYKELMYGDNSQPDCDKYGVFFALTKDSFEQGYAKLVKNGFIADGEKIVSAGKGTMLYGTLQGIKDFYKFYNERDAMIPKECNAQEVYCFEYNNHECMFDYDGDNLAMQKVIHLFGADIAKNINRRRAFYTISQIQETI